MSKRSYNQHCAIAHALDMVGERWTLLIVREMIMGPRRFTDLMLGLPGIGTNLLASRLKQLEAAGIVSRQTLPPPAASSVYVLTDLGYGLEPVIVTLHRWGGQTQPPPGPETQFRTAWSALAMKLSFDPKAALNLNETYEFRIDDEVFHAEVHDGAIKSVRAPAQDPDVVISTDGATYASIVMGRGTLRDAVDSGTARVDGDWEAVRRFASVFGLTAN